MTKLRIQKLECERAVANHKFFCAAPAVMMTRNELLKPVLSNDCVDFETLLSIYSLFNTSAGLLRATFRVCEPMSKKARIMTAETPVKSSVK